MGVGDNIVSIDGNIIAGTGIGAGGQTLLAGEHAWVDDFRLLYQVHDPTDFHETLEIYDTRTQQKTRASDIGADTIGGGGGRWIAWLGNSTGLYDSDQQFNSNTGWGAGGIINVGRDGTYALTKNRQADEGAAPTTLYAPDGRVTVCPPEFTYYLRVTGPTSALWVDKTGTFRALNMNVPKQAGLTQGGVTVHLPTGEDWIVYWVDQYGLIAHPFNETKGYIIQPQGIAFNHDAIVLNGTVFFAYSVTQGERPGDLVTGQLDLTLARTDFTAGAVSFSVPAANSRTFIETSSTGAAANRVANSSSVLTAQLNLLEDEICYNLALLATNILQPLKTQYPNIVIKSGFRPVNTGRGQHETGQAVDIQITNQSPEQLINVASFIQTTLPFDQLILNHTQAGDGQSWIHVSFSKDNLRGQVLTKDYSDTFYNGLYLIEPQTGEVAAAIQRTQDAAAENILSEMQTLQARQLRSLPSSFVGDSVPADTNSGQTLSGASGTGSGPSSGSNDDDAAGKISLISCVQSALGLDSSTSSAFEVTKRVAWLLKGTGCGLVVQNGGDNTVSWNGYTFAAGIVGFPNGECYIILNAVGTGNSPTWEYNGLVEPSLYVAAMDPGTDINSNWMQCQLPTSAQTPSTGTGTGAVGTGSGDSPEDPRVTSSLDPTYLHAAISASYAGTHNGATEPDSDNNYWFGLASNPGQFSDGVWRIGWNRYWEERMDPSNNGSANPKDGDLPALFQPNTGG